ncbi:MAG: PspC domain-containing protein [Dysgonomonas sp.]|nr:PspC domain-containing protein [Dysgonomonas sp.]
MKETIKASIGGYAFTLDIDAYELLNTYLDNLKAYFGKKNDGSEILTDIEYRMSELLQMKANSPTDIITLSDAQHIIEIMGNPVDFDDAEETIESGSTSENKENTSSINKKKESKKLYRDTDHAVLGGVCSGLGHYFNLDPVLVRVIYALSFFISMISSKIAFFDKLSFLIFISYFVLWIAMPAAKTFNQKLAMSGQDPSIEGIETGNFKVKKARGSGLGRALGKLLKAFIIFILSMVGVSLLLSAFFTLFFPSVISFPSIKDFLETNGLFTYNIVASITLVWLIPALMIIYFVIRLLTKFNMRDLVVLGIAFVVWLGVCLYIGSWGVKLSKDYKHKANYTQKYIPSVESDTVHIKLGEQYKYAETVFDSNQLYMIDEEPKSWFLMPKVEIIKDTLYKKIEIDIQKTAFDRSWQAAQDKAEKANFRIKEQGTSLLLKPELYSKDNHWDREIFKVIVYCPENAEIKVDRPLKQNVSKRNRTKKEKKKKEKVIESETDTVSVKKEEYQAL